MKEHKEHGNIIPVKYGGPYQNVEAFADTETGNVEGGDWSAGPSKKFYKNFSHRIMSSPYTEEGRENYDRIFRKEETE